MQNFIDTIEYKRVANNIENITSRLSFYDSVRNRMSGSCFDIAMEINNAIIMIMEHGMSSSAAAMLRLAYESFIRGAWLSECATDDEAHAMWNNGRFPKIKKMVADLKESKDELGSRINDIHDKLWSILCDYTHIGINQISRRNKTDFIEENFSEEEKHQILSLSKLIACLSAVGICALCGEDSESLNILSSYMNSL